MTDFSTIPALDARQVLKKYALRPEKGLGQNFLQDSATLEMIVRAADLNPGDTALEIGPGLGALTRYLATAAERVVAVELDERLLPPLRDVLGAYPNVAIVQGDILELDPVKLVGHTEYVVAANIPYYISTAVIRHLVDVETSRFGVAVRTARPRRMVLTLQEEVAARICAAPGDLSLLALSVQVYGAPQIVATIPAGAFFPPPSVDSACLRVDMYPEPRIGHELIDWLFRAAKAGFSQKRKTLRNSLSGGLRLSTAEAESLLRGCGIDPQRRAETLSIEEWGRLAERLSTLAS